MCNPETLKIADIFTRAVHLARAKNHLELNQEITEAMALELLKCAFPKNKNLINSLSITKNILRADQP